MKKEKTRLSQKSVCFFGEFNPNYSRYSNLIKFFQHENYQIYLCNYQFKNKINKFIPFLLETIHEFINLFVKITKIHSDYLIIGYPILKPGLFSLVLKKRKIILDPFISIYSTSVFDKKIYGERSFRARLLYFYEKKIFSLSNFLLADTNAHAVFFSKLFRIPAENFTVVYVGSDNSKYYLGPPREIRSKNKFIVGFYGKFHPIHGIETILQAASLLKDHKNISFEIIGGVKGNKFFESAKEFKNNNELTNIHLIPPVSEEKLRQYIQKSDIQLGIFGNSIKTKIVIANKVFSALAMKKPVITANTYAISELLTDQKNVILCNPSDPHDLAQKIFLLYQNNDLMEKISKNAYEIYEKKCKPEVIGNKLIERLREESNEA